MKLMMIEWLDTHAKGGWRDREFAQKLEPARCISVGMVIIKPNCYNVIQSVSMSTDDVGDVISIPKQAIIRTRELKVMKLEV